LFVAPVPGTPPVGTAPQDARLALAGLIGTVAQRVTGGAISASGSIMQFTVTAAVWELPDPTTALGAFLSATDLVSLNISAGPGSGSRIDSFAVKQNNYENADADSRVNIIVIAGVASGSPTPPAMPSGYYRYANITVPTGAANAAACTVTILQPSTLAPLPIQVSTLALLNTFSGVQSQHATVHADTPAKNGDYVWSGSAWVSTDGGLIPIIPTSVAGTGVSVGANGKVTFTSATAVSVNGCFTTDFDNYLIKLDITAKSVASGDNLRLRSGGTDDSSTNYNLEQWYASGATVSSGALTAQTSWLFTALATAVELSGVVDLYAPALARATRGSIKTTAWASSTSGFESGTAIRHGAASAFDGFSYIAGSGSLTGNLRVYGYNNE
jgi:hypothetical protein